MKFLIDESLSTRMAGLIAEGGHDAVHVSALGLLGAEDTAVMDAARDASRIVVAADTDFGELLAIGHHPGPSVVLLRRAPHGAEQQAGLLLGALPEIAEALVAGAVVALSPGTARIRQLPISGEAD